MGMSCAGEVGTKTPESVCSGMREGQKDTDRQRDGVGREAQILLLEMLCVFSSAHDPSQALPGESPGTGLWLWQLLGDPVYNNSVGEGIYEVSRSLNDS